MKLHTRDRAAAAGMAMVFLTLCGAGVQDVFAQGKVGKAAQSRASTRKKHAPPSEVDGRANSLVEEGLRHADGGDWAEALKAYRQALAISPRYGDAHLYMGDAYMSSGKYQEAFAAYKEAIRVAPWNAEAHYSLGAAYNDMAQYGDAFKHFVQAIRLEPDHAEAHHGIGYAYLKLENFKEALGYLRRAVRLRHNYAEAHLSLGLNYLGLGQTKPAEEELKVLQTMDGFLARELDKAIQESAGLARSPEQPKPDERGSKERASPGLAVKAQQGKPEPSSDTTTQPALKVSGGKSQRAEGDSASSPQRPAQVAPVATQAVDSASLVAVELSFWDSIKNSADPEEFAAYLKKYPEGQFAELARIRLRALEAKRGETGKAAGDQNQQATDAQSPAEKPESLPAQTIAEPAVQPSAVAESTSTPEETLKLLRKEFPNKFTYKLTASSEDANVASVTSEVVIDYEPLQFDGCRIEWRDSKDILSVSLSDLDPLGVTVEPRTKLNTTFSIPLWNLSITTIGSKHSVREFKGDGSGAVNNYNGLDLQFDNKEKADGLARLLQRAIKLCAASPPSQ